MATAQLARNESWRDQREINSQQEYPVSPGAAVLDSDDLALFSALLVRAGLDPLDFRVAAYEVQRPAHLPNLKALVTVTCGAVRVSRTYFVCAEKFDWFADLSDDIRARVFSAGTQAIID